MNATRSRLLISVALLAASVPNSAGAACSALTNGVIALPRFNSAGNATVYTESTSTADAAVEGAIGYDATTDTLYVCDGTNWDAMGGGSLSAPGSDTQVILNAGGVLGAATSFVYTSAGNVGIGTTSPGAKLDVKAGANNSAAIQWTNFSGNVAGQLFTTAGSPAGAGSVVLKDGNANTTVVISGYNESSYINSGGNFGVGTTSPSAKLEIADPSGANPSGSYPANTQLAITGAYSSGSTDAIYSRIFIAGDKNKNYGSYIGSRRDASGNVYLVLGGRWNGTSLDAVQINAQTGNVGIGETAPQTKLSLLQAVNSAFGGISVLRSTTPAGLFLYHDGTSSVVDSSYLSGGNATPLALKIAGTQYVTLATTGNVGIGTTSPQSTLHIPDGKYLQAEDNNAGAPASGDCDADAERGRISLDTSNNRLYICMGASRGWDYATLTD